MDRSAIQRQPAVRAGGQQRRWTAERSNTMRRAYFSFFNSATIWAASSRWR